VPVGPFVRLPDEVTLARSEVAVVLFALDAALDEFMPGAPARRPIKAAQKLMTVKLWPELGDLLDDEDGE
jgi:hypothetical protein